MVSERRACNSHTDWSNPLIPHVAVIRHRERRALVMRRRIACAIEWLSICNIFVLLYLAVHDSVFVSRAEGQKVAYIKTSSFKKLRIGRKSICRIAIADGMCSSDSTNSTSPSAQESDPAHGQQYRRRRLRHR